MILFSSFFYCLLFWHTVAQVMHERDSTDQYETMHRFDFLPSPIDFRCANNANSRFELTREHYIVIDYIVDPIHGEPGRCYSFVPDQKTLIYYPNLNALDPMMPFYIHTIHKTLPIVANDDSLYRLSDPIHRRRIYCSVIRLIGSTFAEYFERFNSDDETCWKLKEIVVECYNFRHMRQMWVQNVYEKLCLDEDGCFNAMELYGDDVPYCIKYIATEQLKNASFGSWHHSFINYCELTDLIPQAKYANYDRLIVRESGRTDEQLKLMCEYFRFQILFDEGNDGEIRDVKSIEKERSTSARLYRDLLCLAIIATYLL